MEGDEQLYKNANITITDISGRVVKNDVVNASTIQIDTESLGEGIYVLILKNNTFVHSIKFIKI